MQDLSMSFFCLLNVCISMRLVTLLVCNIIISEFVPSPCSLFSGRQSHMNMASATLSFAA